jgi:ferritin-like metal-binding protein YciE
MMHPILNLHDLLTHEIGDLYSAEEQIIAALPKMVKKASGQELKKALGNHLRVSKEHKNRLDTVKGLLTAQKAEPEKKTFLERLFGSNTKCRGTQVLIE